MWKGAMEDIIWPVPGFGDNYSLKRITATRDFMRYGFILEICLLMPIRPNHFITFFKDEKTTLTLYPTTNIPFEIDSSHLAPLPNLAKADPGDSPDHVDRNPTRFRSVQRHLHLAYR